MAKTGPTYGHYVASAGRFEDIVAGRAEDCLTTSCGTMRGAPAQLNLGKAGSACGYSDLK